MTAEQDRPDVTGASTTQTAAPPGAEPPEYTPGERRRILGAACLGWGIPQILRGRAKALPIPHSKEKELLSAIRDNGGSITPAEAAMETSLTVREADKMLSDLAGGGHLAVEGRDGALFYRLPARENPQLEG